MAGKVHAGEVIGIDRAAVHTAARGGRGRFYGVVLMVIWRCAGIEEVVGRGGYPWGLSVGLSPRADPEMGVRRGRAAPRLTTNATGGNGGNGGAVLGAPGLGGKAVVNADGTGTATEGANGLPGGGDWFYTRTVQDGLASNTVLGVYVGDGDGGPIYAATDAGLSISPNGNDWTTSTTANGLPSNRVNGVYASTDSSGRVTILAATDQGASVSTDNAATWSTWYPCLCDVRGVYITPDQRYFAATEFGLVISDTGGTTWTRYLTSDGLVSNDVLGVYADGPAIYAATAGGLSISTDNAATWTTSLTSDKVYGVFALDGSIYAATDAGVEIRSTDGTWRLYGLSGGIAALPVLGIAVGNLPNQGLIVYAATPKGISYSYSGEANYQTWDYLQNNVGGSVVGVYYPPGSFADWVYAATVPSDDPLDGMGGLSIGPSK